MVGRRRNASPKGVAHWGRLASLIDDRLAAAPSDQAPPLDGVRWWLSQVRIGGFRGVADDGFVLEVEPSPGLTVVHAPNGTGKSTIAEAVRAGLWGVPMQPSRELWEPVDRAAGAAEAWVEVMLTSGTSEMRCLWSDASTPPATATWADATTTRVVSVADPDWQAALAAFTPVFSYTETQDRLGTAKDLTQHLEDLLALGPCFALLITDVAQRAAEAKESVDRLQKLKRQLAGELKRVDARFSAGGEVGLPAIKLPYRFSWPDPDDWLAENGLDGDLTTTTYTVPDDMPTTVHDCADDLLGALDKLERTEQQLDTSLDEPVRTQLVELHAHFADHRHDGQCPLCGQDGDWWTVLSATAIGLKQWRLARRTVDHAAGRLAALYRERICPLR